VLADFLKNRVAEICYADITGEKEDICKKIKLVVDNIHGKTLATNFYGFELDREAIMEQLKKRHTLIDVYSDVKTSDGHIFRIFVMIVTSRRNNQQKINSYAQGSRVRLVRKKLVEDIVKYASTVKADTLAHEVLTDSINSRLESIANKVIIGSKL
jgi:small subunit ribosomal protein S3Ae